MDDAVIDYIHSSQLFLGRPILRNNYPQFIHSSFPSIG